MGPGALFVLRDRQCRLPLAAAMATGELPMACVGIEATEGLIAGPDPRTAQLFQNADEAGIGCGGATPQCDGVDMPGLELLMLRDQAVPVDF